MNIPSNIFRPLLPDICELKGTIIHENFTLYPLTIGALGALLEINKAHPSTIAKIKAAVITVKISTVHLCVNPSQKFGGHLGSHPSHRGGHPSLRDDSSMVPSQLVSVIAHRRRPGVPRRPAARQ